MKSFEIQIGGKYIAKVSGKLTTVRVDSMRKAERYSMNRYSGRSESTLTTVYDVTNLTTGRKITFRSAAKFRRAVEPKPAAPIPELAAVDVQFLNNLAACHWIEVDKAPRTADLQAAGLVRYHAPMHAYVITDAGKKFLEGIQ